MVRFDLLRRAAKLGPLEPVKLEAKLLDLGTRRNRVPRQLTDDALERINVIRQSGRIDLRTKGFSRVTAASTCELRPFGADRRTPV